MKKLAIIITHPIQYYFPVFKLLALQCELRVFYTWGKDGIKEKYDPDFDKKIMWDLPLLDGYNYELLENISLDPGSHHSKGIINKNIIESITSFKPNIILIYGYIYESHLKVMRHFKGKIPIWFRGDSHLLNNIPWYKEFVKKIYLRWIYHHVDAAFYVGTNNKAYFERYGIKEKKLVFAPHAIDNERFSMPRNAEVTQLRKTLNIAPHDFIFLFAGKLENNKNPELLLKAFINLTNTQNKKSTKVHLLFVGNGILEATMKSKLGNLRSQIHFLKFQNQTQMPIIYQASNVFCLPSSSESWGLAVNEAMAAGKAVIASDKVGCAIDLVQHGVNGFIFKSDQMDELVNYMAFFIKNPNASSIFGENSRKIISDWTFNRQVEAVILSLNNSVPF